MPFKKKNTEEIEKKEEVKAEPAETEVAPKKKINFLVIGACVAALVVCGVGAFTLVNYFAVKDHGEVIKKDEVKFGSYPQKRVAESQDLQDALDKVVSGIPSKENANGWESYGFYSKGAKEDYFWYKDFKKGSKKYRANYSVAYRNKTVLEEADSSIQYNENNPYYTRNIYFFEYTPIVWRKLEKKSNGYTYLMSSKILDYEEFEPRTAEIDISVDAEAFKTTATPFRLEAESAAVLEDGENPTKGNIAVANDTSGTASGGKYVTGMDGNEGSKLKLTFDRPFESPKVYLTAKLSAKNSGDCYVPSMFDFKLNNLFISPDVTPISQTSGSDKESFVEVGLGFSKLNQGENTLEIVSKGDATTIDYVDVYVPNAPFQNNYENSKIRNFLNEDFFKVSFSSKNVSKMEKMVVDNSLESTADDKNGYICANTNDYVTLLSKKDMLNEKYNLQDKKRMDLTITDYANSLFYSRGLACYWLRTPSKSSYLQAGIANVDKTVTSDSATHYCNIGVVPVISVKL